MNHKTLKSAFVMTAVALCLTACSTIGTTHGYLNPTHHALPAADAAKVGKVVFIRQDDNKVDVPAVYVNERVVGSLVPDRFSETWLCPGSQDVRIGSRTDNINPGSSVKLTAKAGQTYYVEVTEASAGQFNMKQLPTEQGQDMLKDVAQSHLIDRQSMDCLVTVK